LAINLFLITWNTQRRLRRGSIRKHYRKMLPADRRKHRMMLPTDRKHQKI